MQALPPLCPPCSPGNTCNAALHGRASLLGPPLRSLPTSAPLHFHGAAGGCGAGGIRDRSAGSASWRQSVVRHEVAHCSGASQAQRGQQRRRERVALEALGHRRARARIGDAVGGAGQIIRWHAVKQPHLGGGGQGARQVCVGAGATHGAAALAAAVLLCSALVGGMQGPPAAASRPAPRAPSCPGRPPPGPTQRRSTSWGRSPGRP